MTTSTADKVFALTAQIKEQTVRLNEAKMAKLGSGARFKRLEKKLAKHHVQNPGALAAAIGRKKFGKAKFQKLAAAGKKHHHESYVQEAMNRELTEGRQPSVKAEEYLRECGEAHVHGAYAHCHTENMKHGRLAESVRHHEHGKHLHALAHGHHSHAAALADELGDDLMSAHHASHAKEHGKAMRWHHNQLG